MVAHYARAKVTQRITNRSNEVRAEALHLVAREAEQTASAWLRMRETAQLDLGGTPLMVEYRPTQREFPFTIKLLDFRKVDYPGTQMAAAFESDIELNDVKRGIMLMRKISMNAPLRYRGYSFFQSSYIPGPPDTTILSVRSDPGTPFVYAGFIIVMLGTVSMFLSRSPAVDAGPRHKRKRGRHAKESTVT
jgi:cytochrome c biogenesis protein ResB